ncbi:hypothetical protein EX30DRAFT_27730 [Ascodesmis nigricans]|uniref:RNA polymerase II subunit B1 CTD phosphatase RPAP2 homolog n=1 Tax=Ascodesmis nigricans TaxID=341454 RepID=A0A4S2N8R6_9PEZI|nr:hypothetical protein EX30DRAFT_27730 [Ascodesmis nigricans]
MATIAPTRNPPKKPTHKKPGPSSRITPTSSSSPTNTPTNRGTPQPSSTTTTISLNSPPPSTPSTQRTPSEIRRIALHHASAIQLHKSLEASILNSILNLIDLPPPAPLTFKHHLRFFTPSDYDSLIEERNIENLCGYALCANPPKRVKSTGRLVPVDGGRRWVERKQVERFCGEACGRLWRS